MPESLRLRLLSIRAFDDRVNMVDADVVHGREVEAPIRAMLANDTVSDLHPTAPGLAVTRRGWTGPELEA